MRITKPAKTADVPIVAVNGELRVLVCGSRDWTDVDTINKEFLKLIMQQGVPYQNVLVITGGASGADTIIRELCENELGIACANFNAAWLFYQRFKGNKRGAGPIRNGWMLRWGQP